MSLSSGTLLKWVLCAWCLFWLSKKSILRPNLQKFSVVSFRRTLPNNWVFIVLGINNFDYSQKRHQCIYKFYWQRLQPKCRSHWQNWSHWYQSGSGFSWEGIKFLQKKASPGKSCCTILKTNWSLNCTAFCNMLNLFLQIQLLNFSIH